MPKWSSLTFAVLRAGSAWLILAGPGLSLQPPIHAAPAAVIALTLDVGAGRHAIRPEIYGLNFAKEAFAAELDLPVRRWGGNTTTRYNWTINAINHGSDWFFHNNANYDTYTGQTETADDWVAQNTRTGSASLITLPMAGYVAKNTDQNTCGFNVNAYGAQDVVDAPFFSQCGNGFQNGTPIANNSPADTSVPSTSADAGAWVTHLVQTFGAGGVRFYALDNEPGLWNETHRDIHRDRTTYTELRADALAYASAVKDVDAGAQILGPVQDGWTRYFYSSYNNFPDGAAQTEHDNYGMDFVPWYLQQLQAYETANGRRLLDYLDLHFYPQNGVDQAPAGNAATQALRLRSVRALWDPSYVDESWIPSTGQATPVNGVGVDGAVQLIPRMRAWVNTYYPGTQLALTEYNWGGLEAINGALAQADSLGIFGREGLDLATLWNYPAHEVNGQVISYEVFETLPGAYAFRMYRNYDGQKSKFGDVSVAAASADQAQLSIYAAQRTSDSALTLMVLNKTAIALDGAVSLAGFTPGGPAQVYRYSNNNLTAIVRQADQAVTAAGFTASFPANSLTLLVVPASGIPNTGQNQRVFLPLITR